MDTAREVASVQALAFGSLGTKDLPIRFVDRPEGVWAIGIATGAGNEVRLGAEDLL